MRKSRRADVNAIQPVAEMERLLDRDEVARMIGWAPDTVQRKAKRGEFLAPMYLGKNPRWRMKDIVAWIDAAQASQRDG